MKTLEVIRLRRSLRARAIAAAGWLSFTLVAVPSDPRAQASSKEAAEASKATLHSTLANPLANSAISAGDRSAAFSASRDDKRVVASLAIYKWFNLKISGSIDKDKPTVQPLTIEGLANGAVFDSGIRLRRWNPTWDVKKRDDVRGAFRGTDYYRTKNASMRAEVRVFELPGPVLEELVKNGKISRVDAGVLAHLSSKRRVSRESFDTSLDSLLRVSVNTDGFESWSTEKRKLVADSADSRGDYAPVFSYAEVRKTGDDVLKRAYEEAVDMGRPLYFEARFKIAQDKLAYADTTGPTVVVKEPSETQWGLELSMGVVTGRHDYFGLSFKRDDAARFKDDPLQLIVPLGSELATVQTLHLGAPVRKVRSRFQAEYRHVASPLLAVNPMVICFLDDKDEDDNPVFSFELPIYFYRDEKAGGLTGGITVSYRTDQDEAVAGLFVGNVFHVVSP